MIVPESPEAQAELEARIKRNLEAGDWGPSGELTSTLVIPLAEDELAEDLQQSQEFIDELVHFGVKGMRWGVRKDGAPKEKIQSFVQEPITRTTKNGDQFTVVPKQGGQGPVMQALARKFPKHRALIENSASMDIQDKDGNKIGHAQVYRKSKDELNLVWLDIEKSNRGQGYATAVMKSAKDLGGTQGFKKLTLEVPGISPDARHIYEKQGFKVVKEPSKAGKQDIWGGLTHMEYRYDEN